MINSDLNLLSNGIEKVLKYLDKSTILRIFHNENLTKNKFSNRLNSEELVINSAILDSCEKILEDEHYV